MRFIRNTLATLVLAAGVESCDTKMLDLAFDYPAGCDGYSMATVDYFPECSTEMNSGYDTCTSFGYFSLEN